MEPMFSFCDQSRRDLEDQFFLKQDQKLIEQLRVMQKMQESKEALASVSDITDDAVLEKLVRLNIRPETVAALSLVPLIEMAWADGSVDEKEKKTVLDAAAEHGFARGSADYNLLEVWLSHRPDPKLLTAWTHYIAGLCQVMNSHERAALRHDLLDHAQSVAQASGGILGLGSISKLEQQMLNQLAAAFESIK
jgi:hypothetical protein